ncbi:MAG: imidazole glycerol phosphate synthase subunit HisH, partial [Candidatus Omnitrophota bacterium]
MITIVDYGMGNLRSVAKAFERLGIAVCLTQKSQDIAKAEKLVLPGVGAFGDAVRNLEALRLREPLLDFLKGDRPFLGICLGLQLLFAESEEDPAHRGFGVFPGCVRHFPEGALKIPHIGWNRVWRKGTKDCPLLEGIPDGSYFYFVHSYYVEASDASWVASETEYGVSFVSMIWKKQVYA